jgi:vesicle-associated membrane protein 4
MGRFGKKNKSGFHPQPGKMDTGVSDDKHPPPPPPGRPGAAGNEPPSLYEGPRVEKGSIEKTQAVQKQVEDVTKIVSKDVDDMMERGEALDKLQEKSVQLQEGSKQFSKNAAEVKRRLRWKNMRMAIILTVIIFLIIAAVIAWAVISYKKSNQ